MTHWQAAIHLGKFQLRRDWLGFVLTFIYTLYVALLVGSILEDIFGVDPPVYTLEMTVDIFYLGMIPVFGLLMNRTSFRIWQSNVYQKRLAHWRAMPIPIRSIVLARWLQSTLMIILFGSVFMVLQYSMAKGLRAQATPLQWAEVSIVWICYGLAAVSILIILELGFSGKQFMTWYLSFLAAAIVAAILFGLGKVFLVGEVLNQVKERPVLLPAVAIAVAAIATIICFRQTLKRVRSASYSF